MPRYKFVGDFETVLHGLSNGVNATLHRAGHGQPDGSTVVVLPGDEVTTKGEVTTNGEYRHALLQPVGDDSAEKQAAAAERKKAAAEKRAAAKAAKVAASLPADLEPVEPSITIPSTVPANGQE